MLVYCNVAGSKAAVGYSQERVGCRPMGFSKRAIAHWVPVLSGVNSRNIDTAQRPELGFLARHLDFTNTWFARVL